jgi:hypothetical protein
LLNSVFVIVASPTWATAEVGTLFFPPPPQPAATSTSASSSAAGKKRRNLMSIQ